MSDVVAIALVAIIPASLTAMALIITALRTNRKVDAVATVVESVHKEVKTINAQSLAQLADADETRRIRGAANRRPHKARSEPHALRRTRPRRRRVTVTSTIHRVLMTFGGIAAGLGGLFALPENSTLGIPQQAGALLALIAGASIIIANTIRANWPDVAAGTTKTTVETKTGE